MPTCPPVTGDVLVILRHAPHGSSWLREGLDAALVAAAFGQSVTLLFQGDGVLALAKGQQGGPLGQKGTAATLDMLAMYDIESVHFDPEALERFGLAQQDLQLPATAVDAGSLPPMIAGHRLVLTF
ncbi:sulfurtransferase complex subunit TusC [Halomonas sp. MCCC 1A17488]|uniref:Sulfurtransferase complex subunit TusC n=1 Tax=Billgrantia sulfidoxydans TaxID=2733484 RepID=A0ABX7W3X0_9GAMM|nr:MULTISPECIES: sulfurtransferase complex subunit TusC [Halomonas]MCE8015160.1 sulfurtransferase complex subunit TusC [Halomonas sp. MCCC 1A17488]MCG3238493.1 sulfurtransferase complex subunit TusC [Halomonas sp. MCCC 1A17488]QPP47766.1 sulfurtransferase complex subunit TusC [Halomonas sp. SS10-MC5]QTP55073.1 sulfurtransferase complex subunit TusC [Halomonas sulfidoxydans]